MSLIIIMDQNNNLRHSEVYENGQLDYICVQIFFRNYACLYFSLRFSTIQYICLVLL